VLVLALALDCAALAAFAIGLTTGAGYALALLIHLGSTTSLLLARGLPPSRRWLLLALGLTLPLAGPLLAAVAFSTRARAGAGLLLAAPEDGPPAAAVSDLDVIRRLVDAPPATVVLMIGSPEDRRALLSALGRRADAPSIAVLRWALTATPPDVGMEAALALEDMSTTFEKKLAAFREELTHRPAPPAALAAAHHITRAVEAGLPDATRTQTLATEARRYYALARELDAGAAADAALGSARLSIAMLDPGAAVDVLDGAIAADPTPARREELGALREEALLRAHRPPLPALPSASASAWALPEPPPPAPPQPALPDAPPGRRRLRLLPASPRLVPPDGAPEDRPQGPAPSGARKDQVA
jgi:hypothetical protein